MEQAANLYSPLSLAYLGDAVYSLLVRERLMREHLAPAGVLHRYAARYVSAAAQSRACETLLPLLEEDEMRVYNRGRNADPANIPKHAQRSDYHRATAFEAVFGYLHSLCFIVYVIVPYSILLNQNILLTRSTPATRASISSFVL